MKKTFEWMKKEEAGQGMVEYSMILALIAIVVIVSVKVLGNSTHGLYNEVVNKIP
ncbi:MAG: Flp family type IVb pilin [Sedimentibacter sp.]|uniref:Flp family type IVb pilin n=1 Tax=Sedimentibacter sp. TaxID=1960295 RepID=UPI0031584B61